MAFKALISWITGCDWPLQPDIGLHFLKVHFGAVFLLKAAVTPLQPPPASHMNGRCTAPPWFGVKDQMQMSEVWLSHTFMHSAHIVVTLQLTFTDQFSTLFMQCPCVSNPVFYLAVIKLTLHICTKAFWTCGQTQFLLCVTSVIKCEKITTSTSLQQTLSLSVFLSIQWS